MLEFQHSVYSLLRTIGFRSASSILVELYYYSCQATINLLQSLFHASTESLDFLRSSTVQCLVRVTPFSGIEDIHRKWYDHTGGLPFAC